VVDMARMSVFMYINSRHRHPEICHAFTSSGTLCACIEYCMNLDAQPRRDELLSNNCYRITAIESLCRATLGESGAAAAK
jgi:hypothetical protein